MNTTDTPNGLRLAKFLSNAGIAARRRCEELIAEGRVTVNGETVTTPVCFVDPDKDQVCYEGRPVTISCKEYYLFNKPAGYTCTAGDRHARRIIYDLLPANMQKLFYIGRLDRDTEGLLILTNDGELTQLVSHPSHGIEKRYMAECEGEINQEIPHRMQDGVTDEGEFLKAKQVRIVRQEEGRCLLEVILTEGRKREVRRLCSAMGLEVLRLARVSLGNLRLGDLPSGDFRPLTPDELQGLFALARGEKLSQVTHSKHTITASDTASRRFERAPRSFASGVTKPRQEWNQQKRTMPRRKPNC